MNATSPTEPKPAPALQSESARGRSYEELTPEEKAAVDSLTGRQSRCLSVASSRFNQRVADYQPGGKQYEARLTWD